MTSRPKLILGSCATSSWSLRPWLFWRQYGLPLDVEMIDLGDAEARARIPEISPSGRVPLLRDGDLLLWDSLAICEYAAERFAGVLLWPEDRAARALARSVVAEIHAGFTAMRRELPMELRHPVQGRSFSAEALADVARVIEIWSQARERFGADGPFLFGRFTLADAFFAPVCTRFDTYGVPVDAACLGYLRTVLGLPAMQAWYDAARSGDGAAIPA